MAEHEVLALAREDLACYAVAMWPEFDRAAHHEVLIDKLEQVERGETRRLMIFMPPRHGKSLLTTRLFPSWWLGRRPDGHVITACYGQDLADDFGRSVRNFVVDPRHQAIFPRCRLSADSSSIQRFDLTLGGSYLAAGLGTAITGRGAHLLVIDDPVKGHEQAFSAIIRRSMHDWFASVAYTRLQPGGAIVLVQTRWHEDDLAGHLLREQAGDWEVISMPAIAEADESFRKAGAALWPAKFTLDMLESIRQAIGGPIWQALYQQRPSAAQGTVFRRQWWRTSNGAQPRFWRVVQSWDTAFKAGEENDYSAMTTWGEADSGYYLLAAWRGRCEFPELKRMLIASADLWRPSAVLVEDRASGQSLIQELTKMTRVPVLPVKADHDKVSRAQAVTAMIESGRCFLPDPATAPWLEDYLAELCSFPAGLHDDWVDSTTQALNYLLHRRVPQVWQQDFRV